MTRRFRLAIAVVTSAALLGIAGCGDDDDDTTTSSTTTTEESGTTGPTGEDGTDTTTDDSDAPEGTAEVQSLLEQAFAAQGLSSGEATCVAELVAPTVADQPVEDLQDPSYVEDLLQGQEEQIKDCEGQ